MIVNANLFEKILMTYWDSSTTSEIAYFIQIVVSCLGRNAELKNEFSRKRLMKTILKVLTIAGYVSANSYRELIFVKRQESFGIP